MAHYAVLDGQNRVITVFVGKDEDDLAEGIDDWETYYSAIHKARVLRTSYNTYGNIHRNMDTLEPSDTPEKAFRGNYAGIGFTYDETRDAFIPAKPEDDEFVTWQFDEDSLVWVGVTHSD